MSWYVLYTKSRFEKAAAEKLSLLGIEVFCPFLKTRRRWSDRWKWVEVPLFPSYCFVNINDEHRDKVFAVPGIVRYLYYCGKPAIVRNKEMDTLKNWLIHYDHESIEALSFNPNDKILIRSGILIDKEAEVLESKGNYAVLYLESIGLRVKVDLRRNIVEKLKA